MENLNRTKTYLNVVHMEEVTRTRLTHLSIEMVTLTHGHIKIRAQRLSPSLPETELTKVITGPKS